MAAWHGARRVWLVAALMGAALAQTASGTLSLTVNGRAAATRALLVNGKTYVPLDALQVAGVTATRTGGTLALTMPGAARTPATGQAPGGANQVAAVEGCLGEQLFNGVLRLRVQKVEDLGANWGVTLEVRNGTNKLVSVTGATGLDIYGEEISLTTADGQTLTSSSAGDAWSLAIRQKLPPGAALVARKEFAKQGQGNPLRLVLFLDPQARGRDTSLRYTAPDPSFRVRLDCQK